MKKYLIGVLLLLAMVVTPVSTKAVTISELQLMIAQLTAQLAAMQSANNCVVFNQDLSIGDGEPGDGLAPEVRKLQKFLISKNYLNATATGYFGKLTRDALMKWQSLNEVSVTGALDAATREKLNALCGSITPGEVVINSVSGPTTLMVGQKGTWTINATVPSGKTARYSVSWGDDPLYNKATSDTSSVTQSATFTHTFSRSGTYTPTFSVYTGHEGVTEAKITVGVVHGDPVEGGDAYIIGIPTLSTSLAYSAESGSPKLVIVAKGKLSSRDGHSYVSAYGLGIQAKNSDTTKRSPDNAKRVVVIDAPVFPDKYSNAYYRLDEGVSVPFTVTMSYDTNTMFSGSYRAVLSYLNYYHELDDIYSKGGETANYSFQSPATYIVGEQGPYITSVGYEVYGESGYNYKITGERLNSSSLVYLNNEKTSFTYRPDGTIRFNVNRPISDGIYPVYVENPTTGKSNTVYLTIGGNTDHSVSLISPNGGERVVAGQSYTIRWNTKGYSANERVQIGVYDQRYSTEAGPYPELIVVNTTNTGSYTWKPSSSMQYVNYDTTTPNHKIKIYLGGGGIPSVNADESDRPFYLSASSGDITSTFIDYVQSSTGERNMLRHGKMATVYGANLNADNIYVHLTGTGNLGKFDERIASYNPKANSVDFTVPSMYLGTEVDLFVEQGERLSNKISVKTAPLPPAVGTCGSADGDFVSSMPSNNLCLVGVSVNMKEISTGWSWNCKPEGGIGAYCSAKRTSSPVVYSCTDSDGGQNPYVNGYTVGYDMQGTKTTDYDVLKKNPYGDGYDYMVEWFCPAPAANGSVYRTNTNLKCQYGSANGVCLRQAIDTSTTYNITTTVNGYGSVSPSGVVSVNKGDSKTFSFAPRTGYRVGYVAVDNQYIGTPSSYTFSNVQANRALKVTFQPVGTTTSSIQTNAYSQMANTLAAFSELLKNLR